MSGFNRHEFQSLILIRNLTTYTHNVDGLKVCENAYILVGFIFMLVENSPRKRSQHTVVVTCRSCHGNSKTIISQSRLAAHVSTRI